MMLDERVHMSSLKFDPSQSGIRKTLRARRGHSNPDNLSQLEDTAL